jgi:hypothetical protein
LAESKLFQKDNDIQTLAYTSGIAQTLRDKLGLNAWREFFCVTMDDLEQCGLAASEKSSIMSLVTFGGGAWLVSPFGQPTHPKTIEIPNVLFAHLHHLDINKRIVRAQVDQFRKTLNEAMDMYSNIVDTISRFGPSMNKLVYYPYTQQTFRISCFHPELSSFSRLVCQSLFIKTKLPGCVSPRLFTFSSPL